MRVYHWWEMESMIASWRRKEVLFLWLFYFLVKKHCREEKAERGTHHLPSDLPDLSHTLGFPYGISLPSNPKLAQKKTTKTQKL